MQQSKALILSLCLALSVLFVSSCTKENDPVQQPVKDETYYRGQLERFMQSKPPTTDVNAKNASGSAPVLKFKSFKEAYEAFRFLEEKDFLKQTDTIKPVPRKQQANGREADDDYTYIGSDLDPFNPYSRFLYRVDPILTRTIQNGVGDLFQVVFSYRLDFSFTYPYVGTDAFFYCDSNTPSNPQGAIAAPGTVGLNFYTLKNDGLGTPLSTATGSFNNYLPSGTIQGFMSVTVEIAGTALSYFITLQGNYKFSLPGTRQARITVITTLTATGH